MISRIILPTAGHNKNFHKPLLYLQFCTLKSTQFTETPSLKIYTAKWFQNAKTPKFTRWKDYFDGNTSVCECLFLKKSFLEKIVQPNFRGQCEVYKIDLWMFLLGPVVFEILQQKFQNTNKYYSVIAFYTSQFRKDN